MCSHTNCPLIFATEYFLFQQGVRVKLSHPGNKVTRKWSRTRLPAQMVQMEASQLYLAIGVCPSAGLTIPCIWCCKFVRSRFCLWNLTVFSRLYSQQVFPDLCLPWQLGRWKWNMVATKNGVAQPLYSGKTGGRQTSIKVSTNSLCE